ncbi:exopolysaccharide transport family protein [Roseibium litorale]|uniref:Uncharacterized protein n=1 Tax=Roseibium litorale TaxID=2803841 RepID=A0ABR9CP69_9HYPH|nr:exopolysaccharide transport family protein [Roseibium litorale]MBD8892424.1 hypothetical protein [Roseibium litorale]
MDALELLGILRARLKFILLTAVVFVALSAAISLILTPVFTATTAVLVDPTVQQPFDTQQQSRNPLVDSLAIDSQVAVIRSAAILRPVISSENLVNDPEFGTGGTSGLVGMILKALRPGPEAAGQQAEDKTLKALAEATTVKRDGQTFILTIAVDSKDPAKAARLSRAIADSYLSDQRRQLENASNHVTSQIDDRLIGLRERLRLAEDKVQEFRAKNNLQVAGEGGLITEQDLAGVNTSLIEARAALAAAEAKNAEIQRLLRQGVDAESISDAVNSPTISRLREQYTEAARNAANLSADLLPSHPTLVRARSQLSQIQQLIRDEVARIGESSKIELKVAKDRVANLQRQLESTRTLNNADDAARIRLRELETEAVATRTLYENVLARSKQISELDQVVIPDARIISPAVTPESPTWPKKKLIVALSAVLGLLVGACIAIAGTAFRLLKARLLVEEAEEVPPAQAQSGSTQPSPSLPQTSVPGQSARKLPGRSPRNQRLASSLTTLSHIPRLANMASRQDSVIRQGEEVEAIRQALDLFYADQAAGKDTEFGLAIEKIHERIDQLAEDSDARVALLTSSATGQGQTMSAFAIAFAGACRGLKVLLVDADPLQRDLTRGLDGTPSRRQQPLANRVREDRELGLSFVSLIAGQPRHKPFELSGQATRELADIARDHDLTVIDGPLLRDLSSDAPLIAVSDLILVSLAEETQKTIAAQELADTLDKLSGDRPHALLITGS